MWWTWLACTGDRSASDAASPGSADSAAAPPCARPTWLDRDGDGFGDDATRRLDCAPGPERVRQGGDCDDSDPTMWGPLDEAHFVDASADAGLAGLGPNASDVWECVHEPLAGGVAVGDVDGDGDEDLFLPRLHLPSALLLNDGAGRFAASPSWVGRQDGSSGALFVDIDGDRDLDLVVTAAGPSPNLLYVNDGAGGFTEEGAARGIAWDPSPACGDWFGASAADVDLDGDLDLFVAAWFEEAVGSTDHGRLYLNDGAGHFVDHTAAAGLDALRTRAAFGGLFADTDGDRLPDLHLVADWGGSGRFANRGGTFVETQPDGVFTDENGMGGDLGDVDRDGDLDWFVSAIWDPAPYCPPGWGCSGNRLYVDVGGGVFADRTDDAGVREGQWGWGAAFFDYDLDGTVDLGMAAGFQDPPFAGLPGRLWRGNGDGTFDDVTCRAGLVSRGSGRAAVPFDADGDGDLDVLLQGTPAEPMLWRNQGYEGRGWLVVELDQPGRLNRYGIGARVTARTVAGGPGQVRLVHANPSYVSGRPPLAHFGLGELVGPVPEVVVRWPDGAESVFTDVPQGRVVLSR